MAKQLAEESLSILSSQTTGENSGQITAWIWEAAIKLGFPDISQSK